LTFNEEFGPQLDRRQNCARRRLTQAAQTRIRHGPANILQPDQISGQYLLIGYTIQNLFLTLRSHLAGIALATGFVRKEVT
jgi:hypothetical protein